MHDNRPGYVPRFNFSCFNLIWRSDLAEPDKVDRYEDDLLRAWDSLCLEENSWIAWYRENEDRLVVHNGRGFVSFEDRDTRSVRKIKDGLTMLIPFAELEDADNRVEYFRVLITTYMAERAERENLASPPQ